MTNEEGKGLWHQGTKFLKESSKPLGPVPQISSSHRKPARRCWAVKGFLEMETGQNRESPSHHLKRLTERKIDSTMNPVAGGRSTVTAYHPSLSQHNPSCGFSLQTCVALMLLQLCGHHVVFGGRKRTNRKPPVPGPIRSLLPPSFRPATTPKKESAKCAILERKGPTLSRTKSLDTRRAAAKATQI